MGDAREQFFYGALAGAMTISIATISLLALSLLHKEFFMQIMEMLKFQKVTFEQAQTKVAVEAIVATTIAYLIAANLF